MLMLIQFDVCTPLVDALSQEWEKVENTVPENAENEASDEVYYRWDIPFLRHRQASPGTLRASL